MLRRFGGDAALDGVAVEANIGLFERQRLAAGDAQLLRDQIDAGDHLGHRMFDLDARVHFEKVKGAGVVVVNELDGAGALVADAARQGRRSVADLRAHFHGHGVGRRFFDDLLMAPLQRAVALA